MKFNQFYPVGILICGLTFSGCSNKRSDELADSKFQEDTTYANFYNSSQKDQLNKWIIDHQVIDTIRELVSLSKTLGKEFYGKSDSILSKELLQNFESKGILTTENTKNDTAFLKQIFTRPLESGKINLDNLIWDEETFLITHQVDSLLTPPIIKDPKLQPNLKILLNIDKAKDGDNSVREMQAIANIYPDIFISTVLDLKSDRDKANFLIRSYLKVSSHELYRDSIGEMYFYALDSIVTNTEQLQNVEKAKWLIALAKIMAGSYKTDNQLYVIREIRKAIKLLESDPVKLYKANMLLFNYLEHTHKSFARERAVIDLEQYIISTPPLIDYQNLSKAYSHLAFTISQQLRNTDFNYESVTIKQIFTVLSYINLCLVTMEMHNNTDIYNQLRLQKAMSNIYRITKKPLKSLAVNVNALDLLTRSKANDLELLERNSIRNRVLYDFRSIDPQFSFSRGYSYHNGRFTEGYLLLVGDGFDVLPIPNLKTVSHKILQAQFENEMQIPVAHFNVRETTDKFRDFRKVFWKKFARSEWLLGHWQNAYAILAKSDSIIPLDKGSEAFAWGYANMQGFANMEILMKDRINEEMKLKNFAYLISIIIIFPLCLFLVYLLRRNYLQKIKVQKSEARYRILSHTMYQLGHMAPEAINKLIVEIHDKIVSNIFVIKERLTALSNLLRKTYDYSLYESITFRDEYDLACQYVDIAYSTGDQKKSPSDLIRCNQDKNPNVVMPTFLMLNAIQNAYKHGYFLNSNKKYPISVYLEKHQAFFSMTIKNDIHQKKTRTDSDKVGTGLVYIKTILESWNSRFFKRKNYFYVKEQENKFTLRYLLKERK